VEAVQADIFTQLRRLIQLEDAVSRHKGENRKEKGWEEFSKISIPEGVIWNPEGFSFESHGYPTNALGHDRRSGDSFLR